MARRITLISSKQSPQRWKLYMHTVALLAVALILSGCELPAQPNAQVPQTANEAQTESEAMEATDDASYTVASSEGHRPELEMESPIELDPSRGQEIGTVYEAFLSPHQEGGEEEDMPAIIPDVFRSTAPSISRNERPSHGHGILSFTKDLSKAYIHVAIAGVNPEDIVMFHIHCGRPGQLGPILIDIGLAGNLQEYWADNVLSLELTNEDIETAANHGEGLVAASTAGCLIAPPIPDKVKTIAGMEFIARQGELYFNLHTKGQTYFGDIRGQIYKIVR